MLSKRKEPTFADRIDRFLVMGRHRSKKTKYHFKLRQFNDIMTSFDHNPQHVYCPQCKLTVQSKVEHKSTQKTHLWALLLCVLGCCPCAACMYCTECARDAEHFCPQCNTYLGICHT